MKNSLLKNINKSIFSSAPEKKIKKEYSFIKNNKKFLLWQDRNQALKIVLTEKEINIVTPQSKEEDCQRIVYIFIDKNHSWVEVDFGCRTLLEDIPGLYVKEWTKSNISYLKHWLCKIFDELYIQQSDKIIVKTKGSWMKNIQEK